MLSARGTALLVLLIGSFGALAQTGTIKGKIVDAQTREALPFGNVFVNNTTLGTAGDVDGNFEFKNVPFGQSELVFSYVGYKQSVRKVVVERDVVDLGTVYLNQLEQEL
ncbi:MAG TPA: carboxypeptidase-like regulatory domain-containing protein, partial [Cyclobacteriaceae bacterium]|nr:carboxypeptidase-like regulatory domain-containing protein [Cyclobacteriaceae bacterium]